MIPAQVFNLSELMAFLESEGTHPELVTAIRRAVDVGSAHRDLHEAWLALRLLRRLTHAGDATPIEDDDLTTIAGSLLTTAIILYARATDTTPIGRERWFGEGKLSFEFRSVHREIMLLRNKEIAHFGKGQPVDGAPLLEDALVLRPFNRDHPLGYLSSRMHNRAALARRAENLVETVVGLSEAAANERQTEAYRILEDLAKVNDPIMARLGQMPLTDPRLLAVELSTQRQPAPRGTVGNFSGTSVVEVHDDKD